MYANPIMIRTFHSVGHGCFVTERFNTPDGNEIKVVYDCGGNKKFVDREINNTFVDNDELFALCVSHFDYDHINGLPALLKRCKTISNVWIPFLTNEEKIILTFEFIVSLKTNFNYEDLITCLEFINDTESLFERQNIKASIIKIRPTNYEEDYLNFLNDRQENIIFSGVKFDLDEFNLQIDYKWEYIPFYRFNKSNKDEIFDEIQLNDFLKKYIDNSKRLIKEKFLNDLKDKEIRHKLVIELKQLFRKYGGSNENSLILYSGTEQKAKMQFKHNCENCICNYIYCCEGNPVFSHAGCMYFGDYNAKKNYINDRKFFEKYLNKCGIILLPHHGSLESFDNNLLFNNYKFAVSCHGKNDKYGHPSAQVCEKLYLNNKTIISVTEDSSSKAYFTVYDFI